MENPFTVYGKGRAFLTGTANKFPTATPDMGVYTHSHNAYCGYYPSDSFLSFIERKRKKNKKNGSAAHGRTVKAALPFCIWRSVRKSPFIPAFWRDKVSKGNHKDSYWESRHSRFLVVFEPLSPQFFDRLEK